MRRAALLFCPGWRWTRARARAAGKGARYRSDLEIPVRAAGGLLCPPGPRRGVGPHLLPAGEGSLRPRAGILVHRRHVEEQRAEEHTSESQPRVDRVGRLLIE